MKLSLEIDRRDYSGFNKFHFFKTRLKRAIITGLLTILSLEYLLNRNEPDLVSGIISAIVCILIYIVVYYIGLTNTARIPKDNGSILGYREMEFDDNGITCVTKDSSSKSGWTLVKEMCVGKNALYLYVDTNMAYIIPKNVFASSAELSQFTQFVAERIKHSGKTTAV